MLKHLARVNSATKYPSILTYHAMGAKGCLTEDEVTPFADDVILTEKVDGTNGRIVVDSGGDWVSDYRHTLKMIARGV